MSTSDYAYRLDEDPSLEAMLKEHKRLGIEGCESAWKRATRAHKFANGEQWPDDGAQMTAGVEAPLAQQRRVAARLTMSEIEVIIQTLTGREMQKRFHRQYLARNSAAARSAEAMTALDEAFVEQGDGDQVDSAVFKDGPAIGGIAWKRWEYDTLFDEKGTIKTKLWKVWQMMWDPFAEEINLRDRSWHRAGLFISKAELKDTWPGKWQTVRTKATTQSWADYEPGMSSREPWAGGAGMQIEQNPWADLRGQQFWLEYEEWREVMEVRSVGVPNGGMSYAAAQSAYVEGGPDPISHIEMSEAQFREFRKQHAAEHQGEEVPDELSPKRKKAVYKYAYIVGDTILETGSIPTGYWTFQCQTGFRYSQPRRTTFRGLIERLMDPQRWVNVMISMLTRNLQMTPKNTVVYEEGVFRDESDALAQINHPSGKIRVRRGTLSNYGGNPPFQIVSGGTQAFASMVENMMGIWQSAIPRVAGFNPGALGQLGDDLRRISGEVVRAVQDAAMTANAELFDAKSQFSREGAKIWMSFLKTFWTGREQDLIEMIGEDLAYEEVEDLATGQPALDPTTGQPQKRLALPGPEGWFPGYWRTIAVGEAVPTGDQLEKVWSKFQSTLQTLMAPQPDTGKPIFSSEDIARMVPGIPAGDRARIIQRIRRDVRRALMQQQMAQQQAQQGGGEGE
ncbi:MAG TPA: hypothetical protein VIU39_02445 [Anaerolineales bacterium]